MRKYLLLLLFSSLFAFNMQGVVSNNCYTKRIYPLPKNVVFEGLKDVFLKSNINIKEASEKDGFIQGNGILQTNGDKIYSLTITSTLKTIGNNTQINTIVSYSVSEKKSSVGQAGIGGVVFPIAVPWRKEFLVQATGNVKDPQFYIGFYTNLEKCIYDNLMMDNSPLKPKVKKVKPAIKTVKKKEANKTKKADINKTKKLPLKIKDINQTKPSKPTILNKESNTTKVIKTVPKKNETKQKIKTDLKDKKTDVKKEVKKSEVKETKTTQVEKKVSTQVSTQENIKKEVKKVTK